MKSLDNLKKTLVYGLLSAVMVATTLPATAAVPGIPTLDAATGIILETNAIAQAKQALAALKEAQNYIKQTKAQWDESKTLNTGNDRLGDFLNNPELNKVMPMGDWAAIYQGVKDIKALRERYQLISKDASTQQKFDQILETTDALERIYDSTTERVKNAQEMRAKLNQVETPQQKADLQLRYQQEMLEQQSQEMRMGNIQALMQQQDKMENTKRSQNFNDYMTGKSKVLPKYE
ncbi:P-type DNA transfer protein VirB5 [Pseudomonas helleri]|uniref:P-type DNA transfer protein VirB5 n=1 Tax=Pseudomonas helleri TaxID=1608996 RepID=UPI003FD60F01